MGYLTEFHLKTWPGDWLDNLSNEEVSACDDVSDGYFSDVAINVESGKWYDHDESMQRISLMYPEVLFQLDGYGEENGDIWREWYLNGKWEHGDCTVVFPETPEFVRKRLGYE